MRPGEDVRFNCSTESLDSVDWTYRKDESQNYRNIFIGRTGGGGDKSNGYMINNRFDIDFDIPSGQYDLIIRDVTRIDEGEYVCYDTNDQDSSASAKLIVITGRQLNYLLYYIKTFTKKTSYVYSICHEVPVCNKSHDTTWTLNLY